MKDMTSLDSTGVFIFRNLALHNSFISFTNWIINVSYQNPLWLQSL